MNNKDAYIYLDIRCMHQSWHCVSECGCKHECMCACVRVCVSLYRRVCCVCHCVCVLCAVDDRGSRIVYRGSRIAYQSSRIKDWVPIPNFVHFCFLCMALISSKMLGLAVLKHVWLCRPVPCKYCKTWTVPIRSTWVKNISVQNRHLSSGKICLFALCLDTQANPEKCPS